MEAESFPLHELNPKSAGVGAWVLKVYNMRLIIYDYIWQNQSKRGHKLECMLVAADGTYCQGVIKTAYNRGKGGGGADPAAELKQMQAKFQNGTVWKMTKVTLTDEKSAFISSALKKCIDLRKTKCTGILQGSIKMAPAPAAQEELQSILALAQTQRVDLTALIADISAVRRETTAFGIRDIVDVTLVDGSKQGDAENQVKAQVTIFFGSSDRGPASLKSMQDAHESNTVVTFYGLTCIPQSGGVCNFKTGQSFFWEAAAGNYAKMARLQAQAVELVSAPGSLITKTWDPTQSTRQFAEEPAVHSVCGWIAALLRPATGDLASSSAEGDDEVFQINHCHVAVPSPGACILTNKGDRIWLQNIRIMDATGSFTVAVREKAALALSGLDSKEAFEAAHATDNISFPVLASVRVHVTKQKDSDSSQSQDGGAAEPTFLNAVLVETEDQSIDAMPTSALLELQPILQKLALSTEELKIATLKDFAVLPHVGMAVDKVKCELGLVLIGATARSDFQKFGEGYRLVTKNVWDIGFGTSSLSPQDCQAGKDTGFDLVAICTEHNLTEYKMAPPRKAGVQFALVVVSDLHHVPHAASAAEPGRKSFMVERIQLIENAERMTACQKMLAKLAYARGKFTFEGTKKDRSAWSDMPATPTSSAKRVRKLSASPTDTSLPGAD